MKKSLGNIIVDIFNNNEGQGLTEYLMLVLLIAVVSITATRTLGTTVRTKIREIQNQINKEVVIAR